MVETAVDLGSFLEVSPAILPSQELKLPSIFCEGKTIKLHNNNKVSISFNDKIIWMQKKENLNKFLNRNFTQIQKIGILKTIFHGIHSPEREQAIRYLKLLELPMK